MVPTKTSALIPSASQSHYNIFQRAQSSQPLPAVIKMKQNERYILNVTVNVTLHFKCTINISFDYRDSYLL